MFLKMTTNNIVYELQARSDNWINFSLETLSKLDCFLLSQGDDIGTRFVQLAIGYGITHSIQSGCFRRLVQSPCGKIKEGVLVQDILQLHRQQTLPLVVMYAFLWLNKSRHACSSVKICILVDSCVKHYLAKSVGVATGK